MALAAAIGAPCTVLAKEATKVSAPQATLLGRAIVPANTFLPGPTSGQFLGSKPINGVLPPFRNKQPVQGFSAMVSDGKTGVWVLGDNGFGKAGNSADARLRV
jgi:glycerophosphoryl diester phosphodiesterase